MNSFPSILILDFRGPWLRVLTAPLISSLVQWTLRAIQASQKLPRILLVAEKRVMQLGHCVGGKKDWMDASDWNELTDSSEMTSLHDFISNLASIHTFCNISSDQSNPQILFSSLSVILFFFKQLLKFGSTVRSMEKPCGC